MLAPFVLALNDDTCGQVGDPDGGRCFIDMLTACPRRPVDIDLEVFLVDFYIHIVVDFRQR